ncbi:diguanylate cyclase domain-containing protein [Pelomicrobium sp.]|uniref:diguanylate cyclase domain-containing protein n=1 Tax=Pelomicrobium sp. TaxID=2815319 RepID=UPI002FDE3516
MLKLIHTAEHSAGPSGEGPEASIDLQGLLDRLDQMVYRYRTDEEGTMEFMGGGCLVVTGFPAEDPVFRSRAAFEELILPQYRRRVRRAIEEALEACQRFEVEYRLIDALGQVRWVLERGIGIIDADERRVAVEGTVTDITTRKRWERSLKKSEERFRGMVEHAAEGIFQCTPEGAWLYANPAAAQLFGYESPRELMGSVSNIPLQLYADPTRYAEFQRRLREEGVVTDFEVEVSRRDGESVWVLQSGRAVHGKRGEIAYFDVFMRDVTERKQHLEAIQRQATHDPITGLPQRNDLYRRLQLAMSEGARSGSPVGLALLHLDGFQELNRRLGYLMGDQVLRAVAQRLGVSIREKDVVVRIGGGEFALILPGEPDGGAIIDQVNRAVQVVSQPLTLGDEELRLTLSVGLSLFPEHGGSPEKLFIRAEEAMNAARDAGGNTLRLYRPTESSVSDTASGTWSRAPSTAGPLDPLKRLYARLRPPSRS